MRKGRFTEEQTIAINREADRAHSCSVEASPDRRAGNLRGAQTLANDASRLRQLETENARLKELISERDLEIEVSCEARRLGA
jgi:putative transposase